MPVRLPHLIILASLVACREDTTKPAATGSAGSSSSSVKRPELETGRPEVEVEARDRQLAGPARDFEAEPEDAAWAKPTAELIRSAVKGVEVRCRTRQCAVTIIAATAEAAMATTEQLRALMAPDTDDPLAQWTPMPPASRSDGKIEAVVYAHFER